jgi:hypothetical protein
MAFAPEHDVAVGRHLPPSSERVEAFMRHFESRYRFANLGKAGRIMAIAAAHHRLNYIHPFPDGNGRVSRLMSHAMGLVRRHRRARPLVGIARAGARPGEPGRIQAHDGPRRYAPAGRSRWSRQSFSARPE